MDNKAAHTLTRMVASGGGVPIAVAVEAFRIPSRDGCVSTFQAALTKAVLNEHTETHMGVITPDQKKSMMRMLTTVETLADAVPDEGSSAAAQFAGTYDEDVILLLSQRVILPALTAMGYVNAAEVPKSKEQMARQHLEAYFKNLGSETTHLTRNILRLALSEDTKEFGALQQDWSKGCKLRCVAGAKLVRATHPTLVEALLSGKPIPAPYNTRDPMGIQFVRAQVLHWITPAIAQNLKAQQVYGTLYSLYDVLLANNEATPVLICEEEQRDLKRPRPNNNGPHS